MTENKVDIQVKSGLIMIDYANIAKERGFSRVSLALELKQLAIQGLLLNGLQHVWQSDHSRVSFLEIYRI